MTEQFFNLTAHFGSSSLQRLPLAVSILFRFRGKVPNCLSERPYSSTKIARQTECQRSIYPEPEPDFWRYRTFCSDAFQEDLARERQFRETRSAHRRTTVSIAI